MQKTSLLLSKKQLASILGVSGRTVQRYQKMGMPHIRYGIRPKYVYQDVVKWLTENKRMKGGE